MFGNGSVSTFLSFLFFFVVVSALAIGISGSRGLELARYTRALPRRDWVVVLELRTCSSLFSVSPQTYSFRILSFFFVPSSCTVSCFSVLFYILFEMEFVCGGYCAAVSRCPYPFVDAQFHPGESYLTFIVRVILNLVVRNFLFLGSGSCLFSLFRRALSSSVLFRFCSSKKFYVLFPGTDGFRSAVCFCCCF